MKFKLSIWVLALAWTSPSLAQDFSFPTPDYVGGWFSTTVPDITMDRPSGVSANDIRSPGKKSTSSSVQKPPVNENILRYRISNQRRTANIDRFISVWAKSDPTTAARAKPLLVSALPQIGQIMQTAGLQPNNVADAYAIWWVAAWEAVNNRDVGTATKLYQSVSGQAASALLSTPAFAATTDAQKQEMAEALLIQAALIDAHIDDAAGSSTKQAALAKAVNQGAKRMGLDLTKMTLTPDGFIPRSSGRSDAGDAAGDDSQLATNNDAQADGANMGDYALYAVAGTGLLAGMFALGKGFSKKG